jgi:2-hydroxy-3-oxopropionate reductase
MDDDRNDKEILSMDVTTMTIGVIGLGQMGGGIAANLVRAGFDVLGYDLRAAAVDRLVAAGGRGAESAEALVEQAGVVATCVEGRDSIALADTLLLPTLRAGQIYIDHSTVPMPETQRIGRAATAKGVRYLDAPISGGKSGAAEGQLRVFVGGQRSLADACWPLFEAIGNPETLIYCGEIGMGQAAKVVQQLTKRLPDMARLEVMAFGVRAGLDLETVWETLSVMPGAAQAYRRFYEAIKRGETDGLNGLFPEWEYYLAAAEALGFRMPMLAGMYALCKDGARVGEDVLGRPAPSIWNELMGEG